MTHWLGQLSLLLTARDLPRVWGRFDHQRPSFDWGQTLLIAGGIVLAIMAVFVWHRLTSQSCKDFSVHSPARLFRELSRAHGLRMSNRLLLKRLSTARGLANPAVLFVEPKHFDAKTLSEDLKPLAAELQQLRNHLFD